MATEKKFVKLANKIEKLINDEDPTVEDVFAALALVNTWTLMGTICDISNN